MRQTKDNLLRNAIADHRNGRLDEALARYRAALRSRPNQPQVLRLAGLVLHQKGSHAEAIALFEKAIRADPSYAEAYRNLGLTLRAANRLDEAMAAYRKAIELAPAYAEAHRNLGNLLLATDRTDEAAAAFSRAVVLKPDYAEAHTNLGSALLAQKRTERAVVAHRNALALRPDMPAAHNNLGLALVEAGDRRGAEAAYRSALALKPDYAEALSNLSALLSLDRRFDEAREAVERAISVDPSLAAAHRNLGIILYERGELDAAIAALRRAVALNPRDHETCHALAEALDSLGRIDEALEAHREVTRLRPDNPDAHFGLGLRLLLHGRFEEGFREYDWRRKNRGNPTPPAERPAWDGGDLAGRRILLQTEQGLGDALQFIRFARVLAGTAAQVIVEVHEPLAAILRQSYPDLTIVARRETIPDFDCHFPLMSVPMMLGTDSSTVPAPLPMLVADAGRVAAWRERLPRGGLRIGIAWQGNPAGAVDRGRSVPLACFAPLARLPGVRLVSLQKNFGLEQIDDVAGTMSVHTLGDDFDSGPDAFLDTAAVMQSLDLVVSSDTSVAHVAGCLGRPTFILLKHRPDWRWLLDRSDTPWYPTARLFRQATPGGWEDVLVRVADAVAGEMPGRGVADD